MGPPLRPGIHDPRPRGCNPTLTTAIFMFWLFREKIIYKVRGTVNGLRRWREVVTFKRNDQVWNISLLGTRRDEPYIYQRSGQLNVLKVCWSTVENRRRRRDFSLELNWRLTALGTPEGVLSLEVRAAELDGWRFSCDRAEDGCGRLPRLCLSNIYN